MKAISTAGALFFKLSMMSSLALIPMTGHAEYYTVGEVPSSYCNPCNAHPVARSCQPRCHHRYIRHHRRRPSCGCPPSPCSLSINYYLPPTPVWVSGGGCVGCGSYDGSLYSPPGDDNTYNENPDLSTADDNAMFFPDMNSQY